jgi:multicomponent Na+:H+ antiporter subunit C
VKEGSTIPILDHDLVHKQHHGEQVKVPAEEYSNPLPHVLMLTAIVVGVATLGVGLAIAQKLFEDFGSLEEHEIIDQIKHGDG